MTDRFDFARARNLAEWELISMHVPAGVRALILPLRAISLLPEETRPMFDGERGSISVARDYLGDPDDLASTAAIVAVHVGESLSAAAFAGGRLVAESGESFPTASPEPVDGAEKVTKIVHTFAEHWGEARRHVPDEILDSLGGVERLLIGDGSPGQIHCAQGFIIVQHDYLEEPNAMGSTTAVSVLSYPGEALEVGVRYEAVYSDRELVE